MTNYQDWDSKATRLVAEAEHEDKKDKEENDKRLGLNNEPEGPSIAAAKKEMGELADHSERRKDFIKWSNDREVVLTHTAKDTAIELTMDEAKGKAIRLKGCKNVSYVIPEGTTLVKLMIDLSSNVKIQIKGKIITSSIEVYKCEDLDIEMFRSVGCCQVDECKGRVVMRYPDREQLGRIFHQNSPVLHMHWSVQEEPVQVGVEGCVQLITQPTPPSHPGDVLVTTPVSRGEGEFPLDLAIARGSPAHDPYSQQHNPEEPPKPEELKTKAEAKRMEGNDVFRANDFMQAALVYTEALQLDPSVSAVYANRAACWMKLGDHVKALEDARTCTEVDPKNPKGWFRMGMSLHAMKNYPEAIPALLEAEKLEPNNKQVVEAIKMSQLMARRGA